jgi:hypothetical protein
MSLEPTVNLSFLTENDKLSVKNGRFTENVLYFNFNYFIFYNFKVILNIKKKGL